MAAMKRLCIYLRGADSEDCSNKTDYREMADSSSRSPRRSVQSSLKRCLKALKIFFPSLTSASSCLFLLLVITTVGVEFVVYKVGLLSGQYYSILQNKNLPGFRDLALMSIGFIVLNAFMRSLIAFLASLLSIVWRKYLTLSLHKAYFANKNFYYLQQLYDLTNNKSSPSSGQEQASSSGGVGPVLVDQHMLPGSLNSEPITITIGSNFNSKKHQRLNQPTNRKTLIDNPDQRITQDVNSLCESISNILPVLIVSPFVLVWYTYQAFITAGYLAPLSVFVYFIFWSVINGPLTKPIAALVFKQDKKEGDFRFRHMNIRSNAESIAFYDSSSTERNEMNKEFDQLLNISFKRNWKEFILKFFVNTSQYMGGILAFMVLAIPIFTHVYDNVPPADLAQLISNFSFKCQYLIYLCTRLYDLLGEISKILGNSRRLSQLVDQMNHDKAQLPNESFSSISRAHGEINQEFEASRANSIIPNQECLKTVNLTIRVPGGRRCLIEDLNMTFREGENILITGRSGCGKTSLFRCLCGLWKCYSGEIEHIYSKDLPHPPTKIFFLPQSSYFTNDCLLAQVIYPSVGQSSDNFEDSTDHQAHVTLDYALQEQIIDWLREFELEHLLEKIDSDLTLKPSFNWTSVLSAGEKQRLSFLRVLYHRPRFVLLDEFTSSVDQDTETLMYSHLARMNTTFMSIAHRDTVRQYHTVELKFGPNGSYELVNLPLNSTEI